MESKDFKFFFLVELWLHLAYSESAPGFFNNYEDSIKGQYFRDGRRDIISEPHENKMQLKYFACPSGKYHSAYSPYALNEVDLALTQ